MSRDAVVKLLTESSKELAEVWLVEHLAAAAVETDEAPIRGVHHRAVSLLSALRRALAADLPDDWGGFGHREVVQTAAMMAHALAEAGATGSAAGALIPSLGLAMVRLDATIPLGPWMVSLSTVVGEAFTAAQRSSLERRHQAELAEGAPILTLSEGEVVVIPCAALGPEAALTFVDRAMRVVLVQKVSAPLVVLELSHLDPSCPPEVLETLLSLSEEVLALGGRCAVVGLGAERVEALERAGVDLSRLTRKSSVSDSLCLVGRRRGLLWRLGRALR